MQISHFSLQFHPLILAFFSVPIAIITMFCSSHNFDFYMYHLYYLEFFSKKYFSMPLLYLIFYFYQCGLMVLIFSLVITNTTIVVYFIAQIVPSSATGNFYFLLTCLYMFSFFFLALPYFLHCEVPQDHIIFSLLQP